MSFNLVKVLVLFEIKYAKNERKKSLKNKKK